VYVKREKRRLR